MDGNSTQQQKDRQASTPYRRSHIIILPLARCSKDSWLSWGPYCPTPVMPRPCADAIREMAASHWRESRLLGAKTEDHWTPWRILNHWPPPSDESPLERSWSHHVLSRARAWGLPPFPKRRLTISRPDTCRDSHSGLHSPHRRCAFLGVAVDARRLVLAPVGEAWVYVMASTISIIFTAPT